MIYYDIHTHQTSVHPEDVAIQAVDLNDPSNPLEKAINNRSAEKPNPEHVGTASHHAISTDYHAIATDHLTYYSVGIHPWHPDKNLMPKVCQYATLPSVVAIGETGLDKITADTPEAFHLQQELFAEHIRLSEKTDKPLIIHCVKAWDELLQMHKAMKPTMPWIIHGFRGKEPLAAQLLNAGLYLSFGPLHHPEALKTTWKKQRLFIETDDKQTDIRNVYRQIASDLDITVEELCAQTEALVRNIFFITFAPIL